MKWIYVYLGVVVVLNNLCAAQSPPGQKPKVVPSKPRPKKPSKPRPSQQKTEQILPPTVAPFDFCEVGNQYKIQCGPEDISASDCNAINCCWAGEMCYYGKSVTLQCTKDGQFILVVAREATQPNIDTDSITLLGEEQDCQTVDSNSAFAIYQFPVTACGTIMTEEPGVIIYENRMTSSYEVAIGPRGSISRDSTFELIVQCKYHASSTEALVIEVNFIPPPPVVAAGPLQVELRLANGQCAVKGCDKEQAAYSSYYTEADYPVTKVLREPVYVDVHMMGRTDPNLVLTLGRCWATTKANPLSLPQWDLLVDGCPSSNDRYLTKTVPIGDDVEFQSHHSHFVFKMFTFVDQTSMTQMKEMVFIHCDTAVCVENCAPKCNRKRRDAGRDITAVTRSYRPDGTRVSSGEMHFIIAP